MIFNDLSKLKDVEFYSYCDDGKGNIEIMFRISDEEQYRLIITEKDLKSMCKLEVFRMIKCKDCRHIREFNERSNQWCCSISRSLRCVNANKLKLCMYFRKR